MSAPNIPGRILRRCINCGISESVQNPLLSKTYEGITFFVCEDVRACARRYKVMREAQMDESGEVFGADPWKIEFKPGY